MVVLVWIQVAILFGAGALTMGAARLFGRWSQVLSILLLIVSSSVTLFVIYVTEGSVLALYPAAILVGQLAVRPLRRAPLALAPLGRHQRSLTEH